MATFFQQIRDHKTAFNELAVAEITPVVQIQFPYSINPRILEERNNGGSASIVDSKLQVSSGAGANQSSQVLSRVAVKYNPGQGGLIKFTSLHDTPAAGNTQYTGIGDTADGYFIGYNGIEFGIQRRRGGSPEVRTLTITTGSSTAENITITLNGDPDTGVSVTNTADTTQTANEIAAHDFSNLGPGWTVHSMGSMVIFESFDAAPHTGSYSLTSATSAVGTFAQTILGIVPTAFIIPQTSWNLDKLNGKGPTEMFLNPQMGNVFEIQYQWLGFGAIDYFVENPATGAFINFHRDQYANANILSSVSNPTLPLCIMSKNTFNTTSIALQIGSMGGFIEGKDIPNGLLNSVSSVNTGITTTETPILSIHNHTIFQGVRNRVRARPDLLTASVDPQSANKPATLRLRLNPTLIGASFSPINTETSPVRLDTSATAVSGGDLLFSQALTSGSSPKIELAQLVQKLNPFDTLTVSLQASTTTVDSDITLTWSDIF